MHDGSDPALSGGGAGEFVDGGSVGHVGDHPPHGVTFRTERLDEPVELRTGRVGEDEGPSAAQSAGDGRSHPSRSGHHDHVALAVRTFVHEHPPV